MLGEAGSRELQEPAWELARGLCHCELYHPSQLAAVCSHGLSSSEMRLSKLKFSVESIELMSHSFGIGMCERERKRESGHSTAAVSSLPFP